MRIPTVHSVSILALLVIATPAQALITSYGLRQIEEADAGCVGGLMSDHGNTAYFRGDTARLNKQLGLMAQGDQCYRSMKVVLHAGATTVDPAYETPQTGFGNQKRDQARDQMPIDWSICKSCPFDKVRTGLCKCDERNVSVHIWVANEVRLDDSIVPTGFAVHSAGEIDEFVKRHADTR